MNDATIISYPGYHDDYLLSLTGLRSRYMVPFAGHYRVVDFTLRNAFKCKARNLLVFSRVSDDLAFYIDSHPLVKSDKTTTVKTVLSEKTDVRLIYDQIKSSQTSYYILHCGDNPGFINFNKLFAKYESKKVSTVLFKLKIGEKASLAYTILITTRKFLMVALKKALSDNVQSPNVFEMVVNTLINRGVFNSTFKATYWPLRSVPDYYDFNMFLFKDQPSFNRIYEDPLLRSGIVRDNTTQIGPFAKITRSYISDGCILNGTIENSIIFPGVIVAERAVIRDSILLPFVGIGHQSVIQRSVVDEFTDYNQSDVLFNVSEKVRIGTDELQLKNNDFPRSIYNSITLIGKNSIIPSSVRIGAACYVAAGISSTVFNEKKTLYDGLSILHHSVTAE
ncbi:MAG: hypothetical protein PF637_04600 [Spirochaetes bacterium]|jgi:ADP-glucose pyrophosphorylase|nr:hypothetical protein [Spirochaetota bacterium]